MADHQAWLLLGSNLDPENHLTKAIGALARRVEILDVSSVWQSPPANGASQPDYLNAALRIRTDLSPEALHAESIVPVEAMLGRVRSADRFAARTIDIDLVLYDDWVGEYSGKRIPHPDILLYAHAALPLAEISPEKLHPVSGEPLRAIAARLQNGSIRRREDLTLASKEK